MRQQHPSLLPLAALVSPDRPEDVRPLTLRPQLHVQRAGVLAEHVVPEGHAEVAVGRWDGHAGQAGHLVSVLVLACLTGQLAFTGLHVDEIPPPACRGQQRTRKEAVIDYLASFS